VFRATVLVGGHPFDETAFNEMLASLDGIDCSVVAHPDAADLVADPDRLVAYADALVLYDMPGLRFTRGQDPDLVPPPHAVTTGYEQLWKSGLGIVALHHSIASWPAWPRWREVIGGRFHYVPADGWPDSGYRHDVTQRLTVVDTEHPVTAGLDGGFELTDEVYLCPIDDDDVAPLITTDAVLDDQHTWSARRAVHGHRTDRTGWSHPPGSRLAVWTKDVGASRLVYIQPGDGPSAFTNPHYRRLLTNAIRWVANPRITTTPLGS
jgi:uncharacterized protein